MNPFSWLPNDNDMLNVNEIFYSIQGEGFLAGVPSVFIRTAGCPLRCRWCDTKYAWGIEQGRHVPIEQIVAEVGKFDCRHIVITGGEPMIQEELADLSRQLKSAGKHITIETSGIIYVQSIKCDLMSISPKMSNSTPLTTHNSNQEDARLRNSHEKLRLNTAVLRKLTAQFSCQLKFVVETEDDIPEIEEQLKQLPGIDRDRVLLMPQSRNRRELIDLSSVTADLCIKYGFVFGQRLQLLLWDNTKGR